MKALAGVLLCAVLVGCAAPLPPTTSTEGSTPSATPPPSPSPTPQPSPAIVCVPGPLTSSPLDDPCPSAITAVDDVVAPLGLPIARLTLVPDYFVCGDPWIIPGNPAPACLNFAPPGQWMHGWVGFTGSPKVAAVLLGRALPISPRPGGTPPPSPSPWPGPWHATVRAFAVPPAAGWVFPTGTLP